MGVNGTSDGHAARSDWLGPAIVPDATPYTVQPITIEVPELPVGVDMEQDRFFPRPTYKSGTVVRPTATATVFVGGTLVDAGGEPVALAAGTVLQNDEPVAQFFTNRAGGFQIYGLTPGSYDAALAGDQSGFSFTVAAGTSGFVGLGTVRMGDRIDMTDIDTTETEP
jgi:outer membrane usher protein